MVFELIFSTDYQKVYRMSPKSQAARPKVSSALQALSVIARQRGIDILPASLVRSHPFGGEEPSNSDLVKMSAANGLVAQSLKISRGDLKKVGRSTPAMLRFSDGKSLVLMGVRQVEAGYVAIVSDPLTAEETPTAIDETALFDSWEGDLVLFKRSWRLTDEDQPFGLWWLVKELSRQGKIFRDISVGAVVTSVLQLAPAIVFLIVINRVIAHRSYSTLFVLLGALVFSVTCETLLGFLRRYLLEVATSRIDGRLNLFVYDKLLNLPLAFFERNSTGTIAAKVSEVARIRNFLTGQLFNTLLDCITLTIMLPVLFYLSWQLSILVLVLTGIVAGIYAIYLPPIRRLHKNVIKADLALSSHQIESIHGIRAVKSLALDGLKRRERDILVARLVEARTAREQLTNYPQTFVVPFERMIYVGSMALGALMVLNGNTGLNVGSLVAFSMIAGRVSSPLLALAGMLQAMEEVRGAVSQVASVINSPAEGGRSGTGLKQPIRGQIAFQDVRFRYSPTASYALDRVSFEIEQGTIVGVMGRSGSGKSTVARMLQGLQREYEGMIKIDGMDLREIDVDHLRSNVGVVLQENFLFSGTIRENISAARPNAGFDEIVRAAQMAGAEEFIERMPRGYETPIEEGAVNLSGGQRQRLAIARTLLIDPPILILDEATSALDAESEAIVNANLLRMARGRTMIIISHRLSSLVDCDQILVLERGKVYDSGRHEALLGRCDIYKSLWHQQNRHLEMGGAHVRLAIP
jgi:ATP-binding cassette subfamily B protein